MPSPFAGLLMAGLLVVGLYIRWFWYEFWSEGCFGYTTKSCWVGEHIFFSKIPGKYYYETDELPDPRPTQPQEKNRVKSGIFGTLFPYSKSFFMGWDWFYVGNRLQETHPSKIVRKHPYFTGVHINQDLIWCVKMGVYMGFWVHGGSWLIWFPVKKI